MQLRPIQGLALHDIAVHGGMLGPIRVGGGKTLLSLLAPYVLEAKRPLLLLPASLIEKTERERRSLSAHWRIPRNVRLFSYEMLGRVNAAETLTHYCPDLIIADECFSGETLIRTPDGLRRIDSIRIGDRVWAFGETGATVETVLDAWSQTATNTIKINGYETTDNHPFLTDRGWRHAKEIRLGDHLLCDVREEFCSAALPASDLLQQGLQNQQPCCQTEIVSSDNANECGASRTCTSILRTHDEKQSNASPGDAREGVCLVAKGRPQACNPGGQRSGIDGAATPAAGTAGGRLGSRETLSLGSERDPCVASGYLPRSGENRARGGRGVALLAHREGTGRAQTCVSDSTRLARVESIERSDYAKSGDSIQVYNLHVTGPSTYILERGEIVHNCHRLKNKKAGVTRRVVRYMREHPNTKFVAISGTIMRNSLRDFAHILRWCLKEGAPIPLHEGELDEWADALDQKVNPMQRMDPGALLTLPGAEGEDDTQAARRGFQKRLTETPGVVATGGDQVACSLYVRALEYKVAPATESNFARLRGAWETPDGWPLSEAVAVWRHARELAIGFHYIWSPRPPDAWMCARREWAQFVRETLAHSRTLDTELQVANACKTAGLDDRAFSEWAQIRPTFTPNVQAVWHDDSALEVCQEWMRQGAGIVWCEHTFFAQELARRTGAHYFGAQGKNAQGLPIESADPGTAIIASVAANSTGRNLQAWSRNLITSCLTSASAWEQLLGRTHRDGQQADEVTADVLFGCAEHWQGWVQSQATARMSLDTMGDSQKLLLADCSFPTETDMLRKFGARWLKTVQQKTTID